MNITTNWIEEEKGLIVRLILNLALGKRPNLYG